MINVKYDPKTNISCKDISKENRSNDSLEKDNKIFSFENKKKAIKYLKEQENKLVEEIINLKNLKEKELIKYFDIKLDSYLKEKLLSKNLKKKKIKELEKELDILNSDYQILARCPTLPPFLWREKARLSRQEKEAILNKYI